MDERFLGILTILLLLIFFFQQGAKQRRDQRFINLGFDGYKGFKNSSQSKKDKIKQDYTDGLARGELIGREFDDTAFKVGEHLEQKRQKEEE